MAKQINIRPIAAGLRAAFPIRPTTPALPDMVKCFFPLDQLICDLRSGEVAFAGTRPVMLDNDGGYAEIQPSLEGWCSTLERMASAMGIALDLGHMRRLAKRLEHGIQLTTADIDRFVADADRCRSIYLACPNGIRQRAYTHECIEMELTDLGLREAA